MQEAWEIEALQEAFLVSGGLEASNATDFEYDLQSSEYKRQHSDHGSRRQKRVVDKLSTKMTQARGRENLVVIHSRRARLSTHRVLVWLVGSWDGWAIIKTLYVHKEKGVVDDAEK